MTMMTEKEAKNAERFRCEKCDFSCSKKSNYDKHILTRKHTNDDIMTANDDTKKSTLYICNCGRKYRHRQGLCTHKKTCDMLSTIDEDDIGGFAPTMGGLGGFAPTENMIVLPYEEKSTTDNHFSILTNLVMEVVKSNLELQKQSVEAQKQSVEAQKQSTEVQKQLIEVCKNIQPSNNNNNSHNNSHNTNTFNMQVFLNEECKDAINLSDFVNSFEIQLEDLESVGILGYAKGMSNMIIKELKLLDVYRRPIHCSDARREIFYVKENNVWERETPDNSTVKTAIRGLAHKNMGKLSDWRDKYPDCIQSDSIYNDIYINLMQEACGGRGDTATNNNKIFKNIIKEVLIKK